MNERTTSEEMPDSPRAMSDAEIEQAAQADPYARPLTAGDLTRMRRTPQVKIIRRALRLSEEEFSARYRIPLATLRDWEQGRSEPDQTATAYLSVIARDPERISQLLNRIPA